MKPKVLIIGALPKTVGIGGVTIHIERLIQWINKDTTTVDLCDYKILPLFSQIRTIMQYPIIHIHVSHPILRLFYVCISWLLNKKTILTIHGDIGRFSYLKNGIDKLAIEISTIPIVINSSSFSKAIKWNKKAKQMSAFIPPMEEGTIPNDALFQIIERKKRNKKIYCTNASARSYNKQGEEIYGIDFLIKYFQNEPKSCLIISDPTGEYSKLYKNNQNIIFISGPHSFYSVIKYSDVLIRATATDGDSISIKEGLYLNKNVIATDRVPRPNGVILYHYNNIDSFKKAINQTENAKENNFNENTIEEIKTLYNILLSE